MDSDDLYKTVVRIQLFKVH